ncbi:MAG TPA: hypothetical protein PK358_12910 [Spirochaetota bacterium]|nr:hypothetical protein [Spirochaetota bacterium]HPJ35730.1 hypothetical protein [Spirochaetota bacterium]
MKLRYLTAVFLLLTSLSLFAGISINFKMVIGVRMGPSDSLVEGAAHFRSDSVFVTEVEYPDGVLRESGTYSYDAESGVLVLSYRGTKGTVKFNVLSTNGRVKLLMVNRVAEAPPFVLELIYGSDD